MHQRLAGSLARDIVSGRLEEGSEFPTGGDLTRAHGVSRTVVRETLQALSTAGLINVQHGKRTVVNGMRDWRLLDLLVQRAMQEERLPERLLQNLYEARLLIECETARLCASRACDGLCDELDEIVRHSATVVRALGADPSADDARIDLDRRFHGTIGDGSGNVVLARVARDAHRGLVTTWERHHIDKKRLDLIHRQHRDIARAIRGGDPDAAAAAMRRHIEWSLEDTVEARQARLDRSGLR